MGEPGSLGGWGAAGIYWPGYPVLEYASHEEKTYRAEMTFGFQTDTGDTEGKIIAESPVLRLTEEEIDRALESFLGDGFQIPPMYSAISVKGTKLYKLARQGIEIKREPRPITIRQLRRVAYTGRTLVFDVTCSKGTFIRTLTEDLADKLGMKGTMSFLLRRQAGVFTLEDAHTLEEIAEAPARYCLDVDCVLAQFPRVEVNALQGRRIAQEWLLRCPMQNPTKGSWYRCLPGRAFWWAWPRSRTKGCTPIKLSAFRKYRTGNSYEAD